MAGPAIHKMSKVYCDNFYQRFFNEYRSVDKILAMIEDADPCKIIDSKGSTLLHAAIRYCHEHLVYYLIRTGANINAQDNSGKTPLMQAIKIEGFFGISKLLLEANADIYVTDNCGKSVLSTIFDESKPLPPWLLQMFFEKLKLDSFAAIESIAQEMMNVECSLHCAVLMNNSHVLKILLESGNYDINHQQSDWYDCKTPLHVAVEYSKLESVKTLVQYGADVNKGNNDGAVPLTMYACDNTTRENVEILRILVNASDSLTVCHSGGLMQISHILQNGNREAVNLLLKYDVDLFATDKYGNAVLHYLVHNTNPKVIEELKGKQFNVDALNSDGKSPLHLAAELGRVDPLRFLLNNGANVNLVDSEDGLTPLLTSLNSYAPKSQLQKCIKVFIEKGADVQFESEQGRTAFDIVLRHETPVMIKPILAHLALLKLRSPKKISQLTSQKILSHSYFKKYFRQFSNQLRQVKLIFPEASSLLLKFITDSDESIASFARNKKSAHRMLQAIKAFPHKSRYTCRLKKRLIKAIRTANLRRKASPCLFRIIGSKANHIVVEEISTYLSRQDLQALTNVFESVDVNSRNSSVLHYNEE